MARENPHVDPFIPEPPRLGGLTKDQEREVADLLEKGFGLNPKYGIKGNLATGAIFGAAKKIHGMSDKEWAEMLRGLPHYGDFQDQDIDAIQEHFLNKYPVGPLLKLPVPQEFKLFDRSTWPNNWKNIGETYGIGAGVLPSDAAYQKIMSISPDALSGIKVTGLGDVPKMANGGLINGTNGNPGMAIVGEAGPEAVISNNAQVVPLPTAEEKAFWANHPDPMFNAAQYTLQLERMTDQEKIDAGLMDDPVFQSRIDEVQERAEKERRDKRSQQKWDAIRRARQYDAIAKRIWT